MSEATQRVNLVHGLVGRSHRHEMPVRWGDLDALNHVNNTVYFRFMEEARVNSMNQAGIGVVSDHRAIVLAHASCDFLRPVVWPATVVVETRLVRIGNSSLECDITLSVCGEEAESYARGRSIVVGIDSRTGRASPWTYAELQGLADVFDAAAA